MNWLSIILFIAAIAEITSFLEKHANKYFVNNGIVKQATEIWKKHMLSHQTWLAMALQENFGHKGINVYVRRPANPLLVTRGYYHTDNQVHIVYHDMNLEEFPHLSDLTIHFPLTANVIEINAAVSRMIIHTDYVQFRNTSNMIFDLKKQDPYTNSPFLFEQAQAIGQLAITVEGCKLSGIGIVALTGHTVSLGNTVFRLHHCLYNFEIFTPGVPSPPVVADYLPYSNAGLKIEHLITRPLSGELAPMLQAALQTYVNTSAIFMDFLPSIRLEQEKVFEHTTNYVNNVVRNLNALTISQMGAIKIDDLVIHWNDSFGEGPVNSFLTLNSMILTGLESVYSAHTGGPFKMNSIKISEELRYGALQVRGSIDVQVGEVTKGMFEFAVEINDVEVDVTANIKPRHFQNIEVMGWRDFQFSSPGMTFGTGEPLITGYLLSKIPIYLGKHMFNLLPQAISETNKEYGMLEEKLGDMTNGQEDIGLDGYSDGQINNYPDGSSVNELGINEGYFDDPGGNTDYGQGNADSGGSFGNQGFVDSGNFDDGQEHFDFSPHYYGAEENDGLNANFDGDQASFNTGGNFDIHENVGPGGSDYGQAAVNLGQQILHSIPIYDDDIMNRNQNNNNPWINKLQPRGLNQRNSRRNVIKSDIKKAPPIVKSTRNHGENEIDMHTQIKKTK